MIVKSEDNICPIVTLQNAMRRAGLSFNRPSDTQKGG